MSIKWTKELLAEVRNEKGVVLGMMSKEAAEALNEVRREQGYVTAGPCRVECYSHSHDWVRIWGPFNSLSPHRAYRLIPDWTPDELREKAWEDVPVTQSGTALMFQRAAHYPMQSLDMAQHITNFIGYVYPNGLLSPHARLVAGDNKPALVPVAVRFAKKA